MTVPFGVHSMRQSNQTGVLQTSECSDPVTSDSTGGYSGRRVTRQSSFKPSAPIAIPKGSQQAGSPYTQCSVRRYNDTVAQGHAFRYQSYIPGTVPVSSEGEIKASEQHQNSPPVRPDSSYFVDGEQKMPDPRLLTTEETEFKKLLDDLQGEAEQWGNHSPSP